MNVIWLTSSYPLNEKDTTSIFLKYLAEALVKNGVQLRVIAPDHEKAQQNDHNINKITFTYFIPRKIQKLAYGSGILSNLKQNLLLFGQIPFFLVMMALKLVSQCRKDRPHIIHAHWIFPVGTVAVLVGKLFHIPVMITAHGGDAFSLNFPLFKWLKRWTVTNATICTSNTNATKQAITSNISSDLINHKTIPMGVDFNHFSQGDPNKYIQLKSNNIVLLFVGRLVEKKGVRYLIDAYQSLVKSGYSNICLWIVGDGEQRNALELMVKNIGLNNTHFFGKVGHQQLRDIYATADIFVAPSVVDTQGDTEGQGVVFLEAMANGKPVVTTDVGGITDVLQHKVNAMICQEKNSEDIANLVRALLDDRVLYDMLSDQAKKTAMRYDWSLISSCFYSEYKTLCSIKKRNHE